MAWLSCNTSRSIGQESVFQRRYFVGGEDSCSSDEIEGLESGGDIHVEKASTKSVSQGEAHKTCCVWVCIYSVWLDRLWESETAQACEDVRNALGERVTFARATAAHRRVTDDGAANRCWNILLCAPS